MLENIANKKSEVIIVTVVIILIVNNLILLFINSLFIKEFVHYLLNIIPKNRLSANWRIRGDFFFIE